MNMICLSELLKFNVEAVNSDLYLSGISGCLFFQKCDFFCFCPSNFLYVFSVLYRTLQGERKGNISLINHW